MTDSIIEDTPPDLSSAEYSNNVFHLGGESKSNFEFERKDLGDISLHTLKTDLQGYFRKLHRDQTEDLLEKISTIEERCINEVRQSLERHMGLQLEKHFQKISLSSQSNIAQLCSPYLKRAEEEVRHLSHAVSTTTGLCQDIQGKYSFRWERPFLTLIAATALTGAFVGCGILLMQTSSLAVFFMDERSREAYNLGLRSLESKEQWRAREEEKRALKKEKEKTAPPKR